MLYAKVFPPLHSTQNTELNYLLLIIYLLNCNQEEGSGDQPELLLVPAVHPAPLRLLLHQGLRRTVQQGLAGTRQLFIFDLDYSKI